MSWKLAFQILVGAASAVVLVVVGFAGVVYRSVQKFQTEPLD